MIFALDHTGEHVTARSDAIGPFACPECGQPVIPKRGEITDHHFAHLSGDADCNGGAADPWWEPMTKWHRDWQRTYAKAGCQLEHVSTRKGISHRADIILPDGAVLEVQHSTIDIRDIVAREQFWRPMLWLWDARKWVERWSTKVGGYVAVTAPNQQQREVPRIAWTDGNGRVYPAADGDNINHDGWAKAGAAFKWRRAARSLAGITEPLFWDAGRLGVWWVGITERQSFDRDTGRGWWSVDGYVRGRYTPEEWVGLVMSGRWSDTARESWGIAHAMRIGTHLPTALQEAS